MKAAVAAPAKINLFLAVRGRRSDGFHEIESVMQTVSLHDTLSAELEDAADRPAALVEDLLTLEVDGALDLPADGRNLVRRAAAALAEAAGVTPPPTRLHLTKAIPVAAGMGGGSSDAAATLRVLNELWRTGLGTQELAQIATTLGSDVPFFVVGSTALVSGRGEVIAPLATAATFHWVVAIDPHPLSTADVYAAWDEVGAPTAADPAALLEALEAGTPEALAPTLHNELQRAAFHLRPDLVEGRDDLLAAGALGAIVSGSGPTLVALAADAAHARAIADDVGPTFADVEVVTSPVPPAVT